MKVDIIITSQSNCEFNSFFADGDLTLTDDGFILNYILDGKDKNCLIYNGKSVLQSRSGGLTYTVEFIKGQKCYFLFKEMGLEFSQEAEVNNVSVSINEKDCTIEISYSDSERRNDITSIFIAATYKSL